MAATKEISLKFPEDFKAAKKIPKGGAMCANCAKWNDKKYECEGEYYIKYNNGSGEIPTSDEKFVCVWWVKALESKWKL